VVRWHCCDLQAVIERDLNVQLSEAMVGRHLHRLGFAHVSARPRHPGQNVETLAAFKNFKDEVRTALKDKSLAAGTPIEI
jgi:transposase